MDSPDFLHMLANALPMFVIFLFSLCFHEFSHAIVANLRGDPTSQQMGRMTLNPIAHADPLGTVILPLIGFSGMAAGLPIFGWAKPVPVNEKNLKHPKQDMFWIAAAGPISNLILAVVGVFGFVLYSAYSGVAREYISEIGYWPVFVRFFVGTNLALMVFNLIPVHPLDGGKVLARFLPDEINRKLEENQQAISLALFMILFLVGFRFLSPIIYALFEGMVQVAMQLVS